MESIEFHCPKCNNKLIADFDVNKAVKIKIEEILHKMLEDLKQNE